MNEFFKAEQGYIIELLESLENAVLDLEEGWREGRTDHALVHIVFRNAHNLKSAFAMAELEGASALVHGIESGFDMMRNNLSRLDKAFLDSVFTDIDRLKGVAHSGKDYKEDSPHEEAGRSFCELRDADDFDWTNEEQAVLRSGALKNHHLFRVEKLVKTNISVEHYSGLPILEDIRGFGELVRITPAFEDLNRSREEDLVSIFFTSEKTCEELFWVIFDPLAELEMPSFSDDGREEPAATEPVPDMRMLVIEDNIIIMKLHLAILKGLARADVAVNGEEAVLIVQRALESGSPYDYILLDLNIPRLNGMEVLQNIRWMEESHGIRGTDRCKVFIISESRDMDDVGEAFVQQADAYIIKPLTRKKLIRELEKYRRVDMQE